MDSMVCTVTKQPVQQRRETNKYNHSGPDGPSDLLGIPFTSPFPYQLFALDAGCGESYISHIAVYGALS